MTKKKTRVDLFADATGDAGIKAEGEKKPKKRDYFADSGLDESSRPRVMYALYHRLWWCHGENYRRWSRRINALNLLALLLVFGGTLTASLTHQLPVTLCVALGALIKGWMDFKKTQRRLDVHRFARGVYSMALVTLKRHVLFGDVDLKVFWSEMETLKGVVEDFGAPPNNLSVVSLYESRFLV